MLQAKGFTWRNKVNEGPHVSVVCLASINRAESGVEWGLTETETG